MRSIRELLHEHSQPFAFATGDFDVEEARRCFSMLFDRAAEAVFRAGHDLDDVTVDQFVVRRGIDGAEFETEFASWLRAGAPNSAGEILGLGVRVWLDRLV